MLIDCDRCSVRGSGCAECIVSIVLPSVPERPGLDATDTAALEAFGRVGFEVTVLSTTVRRPERRRGRGSRRGYAA